MHKSASFELLQESAPVLEDDYAGLTPDELGRRRASQWTHDPVAVGTEIEASPPVDYEVTHSALDQFHS